MKQRRWLKSPDVANGYPFYIEKEDSNMCKVIAYMSGFNTFYWYTDHVDNFIQWDKHINSATDEEEKLMVQMVFFTRDK